MQTNLSMSLPPDSYLSFTALCNMSPPGPNLHLASSEQWCYVGLEEGEYYQNWLCAIVLCSISAMHNHNEQFFQVGWSTGFDLIGPSSQSSKHLCIFGLYGAMCFINYTNFTLRCRWLGLVGLVLYLVEWPTIDLQCFGNVGWVIWPVKNRPQYDL